MKKMNKENTHNDRIFTKLTPYFKMFLSKKKKKKSKVSKVLGVR